jgi:hypothetical protein
MQLSRKLAQMRVNRISYAPTPLPLPETAAISLAMIGEVAAALRLG